MIIINAAWTNWVRSNRNIWTFVSAWQRLFLGLFSLHLCTATDSGGEGLSGALAGLPHMDRPLVPVQARQVEHVSLTSSALPPVFSVMLNLDVFH